jgi:hypothetical protein
LGRRWEAFGLQVQLFGRDAELLGREVHAGARLEQHALDDALEEQRCHS